MDLEIYQDVLDVSLGNPEADIELYYLLLQEKTDTLNAIKDEGLPLEERSYSFTGLGLKRKA